MCLISDFRDTQELNIVPLQKIPYYLDLDDLNLMFGYIQNPSFAEGSSSDTVTQFLQQCKEVPNLDMFSGEHSMNLDAALVSKMCVLLTRL